jgi:hypothetical protein
MLDLQPYVLLSRCLMHKSTNQRFLPGYPQFLAKIAIYWSFPQPPYIHKGNAMLRQLVNALRLLI